ncbi:hypothetical protein CJF31_00007770 [Rutstroemia sp. NJR-2017a BVV2]|nr:hypothetical protein CJF31_00005330 [Rutstroemia sp. NJR-2017a BVV2]PQE21905.1 hypothetical protein CJF31_00007770 [Rutstroemia sp. NJR-2017a BVV2]
MPSMKKEKHHANSRARRHSDIEKKSRRDKEDKEKDKDTDTESVVSTTLSSTEICAVVTVPPSPESKCPLRFLMAEIVEAEDEEGKKIHRGCPLRRVQLWHTIPLCILAIINLLLIIVALLGLAGYRISMGVQRAVVNMAKSDLDAEPHTESVTETDDGTAVEH